MRKTEVIFTDGPVKTILMDSISYVDANNRNDIIISGSHGGTSSAQYGLDVKAGAAFFNDAGIGKNRAGISGLGMLETAGIIAAAISHESAEIANGRDTYENGIITFVNPCAEKAGLKTGMRVREAVAGLRAFLKKHC